jgi:hypothetical protein
MLGVWLFLGVAYCMPEEWRVLNDTMAVAIWPDEEGGLSEDMILGSSSLNVLVADYMMNRWTDKIVWSIYHSGLVFSPTHLPDRHFVIDFHPSNDSDLLAILVPTLDYSISTLSISVEWRNRGLLRLYNKLPDSYTNFTRIGKVSLDTFLEFRTWVVVDWNKDGSSFDMFTAVTPDWQVLLPARLCHEFVQDSITWLRTQRGVVFSPEAHLFRDAAVVYATAVEQVNLDWWSHRLELFRFVRFWALNWVDNESLVSLLPKLISKAAYLDLRTIVYSRGKYYWLTLAPGLINYCYVPMQFTAAAPQAEPHCMLPTIPGEFNLTIFDRLIYAERVLEKFFKFL